MATRLLDKVIDRISPVEKSKSVKTDKDFAAEFICSNDAWNRFLNSDDAPLIPLKKPWRYGWESPDIILGLLYHAVLAIKPRIIVETGSLAGHATMAMSLAAQRNNNKARIFTHDYDGDPVQSNKDLIKKAEWQELSDNRTANLQTIKDACADVEISFVYGDSRKTLPEVISQIDSWDFWFQDSMHYKSGIQEEWFIMKEKLAPGSIAVFDNIDHVHSFGRWFIKSEMKTGWAYQNLRIGKNRQLWAQYIG